MTSILSDVSKPELPSELSLERFEDEEKSKDGPNVKGPRFRKIYLAAPSCLFLALTMGLASGYSAPATYDLMFNPRSPVKPTESELTWISSILLIGAMVGAVSAGIITNKIGRREVLVFNIVPAGLGWLTIAYARSALVIIIGRFISGLSIGTFMVAVPSYCVEISTADIRGFIGSSVQGFLVIGHMLTVTIGSYVGWNYLALNGACFTIVGIAVFSLMPESPRWLIAQGRLSEAVRVMRDLHGDRIDAQRECAAIHDDLKTKSKFSIREIRDPAIYKPAVVSICIFFFVEFSGMTAIFSYSSVIFETSAAFIDPQKGTIVLAAVQVAATLTSNAVVDRVGRKVLLFISGTFMALALVSLGVYFYMLSRNPAVADYIWVPLASLALYVLAYAVGYGPVAVLMTAEILPTKARSTMTGVVSIFNCAFGFAAIKSFEDLEGVLGNYGVFWMYSVFAVLGIVFVLVVVPETKGRRLEEIENIFSRRP